MARGLYFSEYNVGDSFTTIRRTITETDVVMFAGLSGDYNPSTYGCCLCRKYTIRTTHCLWNARQQYFYWLVANTGHL